MVQETRTWKKRMAVQKGDGTHATNYGARIRIKSCNGDDDKHPA
jgi:hypothetical protein